MWELCAEADSPYAELMTYQCEVNNGGHCQYFSNVENVSDLQKEMSALDKILSAKLKDNLHKAYNAYLILEEIVDDGNAEAIIEECDNVFFENERVINNLLEEYASRIEL